MVNRAAKFRLEMFHTRLIPLCRINPSAKLVQGSLSYEQELTKLPAKQGVCSLSKEGKRDILGTIKNKL